MFFNIGAQAAGLCSWSNGFLQKVFLLLEQCILAERLFLLLEQYILAESFFAPSGLV